MKNIDLKAEFAYNIAQNIDYTNINYTLQFYTWYIIKAIEKNLFKLATIFEKLKENLSTLIWV